LKGSPLLAAALLAMFLAPACGPGTAANGTSAMSADSPGIEVLARRDLDVPLDKERASVTVDLPAMPEGKPAGKRLGLYLDGMDLGRGGYYEVYANLPPGAEPRPEGPHYLGTLSSFGPKGGGSRVGYDLSRLMSAGGWSGKLTLTFVRKGLVGKAAPAGAGRITRVTVVRE
jgi:hypothetical protein